MARRVPKQIVRKPRKPAVKQRGLIDKQIALLKEISRAMERNTRKMEQIEMTLRALNTRLQASTLHIVTE